MTLTATSALLTFDDGRLFRGGVPHQVLSGSLHYFRVHPAQWRDRLERLAALGLNTVDTYVAWNFHQSRADRAASFEGWRDLEAFVTTAGEVGLDVIVRPGPYICAEWDNGGLPAWLTATVGTRARTSDPAFLAAVSTGFPAGLSPLDTRLKEIEASVADGASEIDIVITREHALTGNWQALYDEMRDYREACGEAHVKAILATGELKTLRNVARASLVCMMAGADFIKTSTGKEGVNATLLVTLTMLRMIRAYEERTGIKIGYKPAGGISTAKDILNYQFLMKEELGREWLEPDLFRIGASSLLADIERQLEHHVTGAYSAFNRHAIG